MENSIKKQKEKKGIVVAWWSGGITSAVACRLALNLYDNVILVYIETGSHSEDTIRFKKDCELWYGQRILTKQNKKYKNHFDVIEKEKYINGPNGAKCTNVLKKDVRFTFEKNNNILNQVWGFEFTEKEINRAIRTQEQFAYTNPLFPLIEYKLTKNECAGIIVSAGIELPEMYKKGYNNNNCIGCVKGGAGYWNKIRKDFPLVFQKMAELERKVGATCLSFSEEKRYLDKLNPSAGINKKKIEPECGLFCQLEFTEIMSKRIVNIISGVKSIYDI